MQCSYKSLTTKQKVKIATPILIFTQTYTPLPTAWIKSTTRSLMLRICWRTLKKKSKGSKNALKSLVPTNKFSLIKVNSYFGSFKTCSLLNNSTVMPRSSFGTALLSLILTPSTTNFSTKSRRFSPPHNKVSSTAPPYTSSEMDALAGTKTKDTLIPLTAHMKSIGTHNATCANCMDISSGTVPNIAASIVAPIAERSPDNARTRSPNDEALPHTTFPLPTMDYSQIIPSPSSTLNNAMPTSLLMNNSTVKLMPLLSWNRSMPIQRTWAFYVENLLTVNASAISTIQRLSFAKLITITSILTLNIVIPTIGWMSEEAVHAFFLICLFLFAFYVFLSWTSSSHSQKEDNVTFSLVCSHFAICCTQLLCFHFYVCVSIDLIIVVWWYLMTRFYWLHLMTSLLAYYCTILHCWLLHIKR